MNGRRIGAVVRKDLKHMVRDPALLFLVILFPLMLTLVFGVSYGGVGGSEPAAYPTAVVDLNAAGPLHHWSDDFVANLTRTSLLEVRPFADNASAQDALARGDLRAVVVVPEGFGASCQSFREAPANESAWVPSEIGLYLDRGSMVAVQAIPPIVSQALGATLRGAQYAPPSLPITVGSPSLVAVSEQTAFDYFVPGLFAYGALFFTMTVAQSFTYEREEGLLRRMNTTPLTSGEFMTAQVLTNMVLGVAQVGIIFGAAFAIGYRPNTGVAGLAVAFLAVSVLSLTSVGFGLITATIAKSPGAATGLSFLFIMPQMFLGTFASLMASSLTAAVGRYVPAYYVTDALTDLFLRGAPVTSPGVLLDLGILAVVSVVTLLVGVALFRRYGNR